MRMVGNPEWMGNYSVWVSSPSRAPQLSRARLEQVLLRVFWKLVLPAKCQKRFRPSLIVSDHVLDQTAAAALRITHESCSTSALCSGL